MKLELKHLAGYLPYELLMAIDYEFEKIKRSYKYVMKGIHIVGESHTLIEFDGNTFHINYCKPILHPLSDLTKEIEVGGEKFYPDNEFFANELEDIKNNFLRYKTAQKLLSWHFDIFELIENDLAIDINTLKS